MVAKGLDFEKVTLVGALSADMSLNIPDYLASEKTFQLLTQVAGRAGRGALEGEVVIQTYTPEHFAIQGSVSQDYDAFYREEIKIREAYAYPPFVELANLVIVGPNEKRTIDSAFNLHRELQRFIKKGLSEEAVEILGPNPCIIQKINHKYRWQIILKFDKMDLERLRNIIHYVCIKHKKQVVTSDVYIGINMSPLNLL
jgi:primosomal protein N' (replication factor Y)